MCAQEQSLSAVLASLTKHTTEFLTTDIVHYIADINFVIHH